MRFAYIDSQGNEVPIPGVDALALRIELGAIKADTQLYDASADRWGPAHTHEIFHTLSRAQDEGFVAPPPPVPPPGGGSEEDEASSAGTPVETPDEPAEAAPAEDDTPTFDLAPDAGVVDPEPGAPEASGPPEASGAPEQAGGGGDDLGLDFTLTDDPVLAEGPVESEPPGGGPDLGAAEWGSFDLEGEGGGGETSMAPADEGGGDDSDETPGFDFGGMDSLELENDPFDEAGDDGEDAAAAASAGDDEPSMDFGGGMQLEEPLSGGTSIDDSSVSGDGGLELEQPMSEFDADAPPAWMEQDGPGGEPDEGDGHGSMDFSPAAATDAAEASEETDARPAPRERPEPRSRPSPPRRPKKRSVAGPLAGLLVVGALAAGGWYGWTTFVAGDGGGEADGAAAFPPVTIPDIPAELLPRMRDLAEEALAGTLADMASLAEEFDIAAEPRDDWLAGVYLANASDFGDIRDYWQSIGAYTDRLREVDTELFHDRYVAAMEEADVEEELRPILLERADSGFLATRQDRHDAYDRIDALVAASLDLHDFLLANESNIRYDPAAGGVSEDPVLEAVPSTPELGDEMWDMVDRITGALDALGTLDRVTTERLTAVLFDRIRRAGVE